MEKSKEVQQPGEVAKLVSNFIGHEGFKEYIISQGLSSRAFSRLEKDDLKSFVNSKTKKGPLVGELMDLLACVDECQRLTAKQLVPLPVSNLSLQPHSSRTARCAEGSAGRPSAANSETITNQQSDVSSEQAASAAASGSSRGKRKGRRDETCIGRDPEDFTDHEVFSTPYQCRFLEPVFGSFFCQALRGRFYGALKANFEMAMQKLSQERIMAINYQTSSADRKIRESIVKKTLKDLDGGQIVGCGMTFTWPEGCMRNTLSDMTDSYKKKLDPVKSAAKKVKLKAARKAKRIKLSPTKQDARAALVGRTVELYGLHQQDETDLEVPEKVATGKVTALVDAEGMMTVQIVEVVNTLEDLPSLDAGTADISKLVKGHPIEWPTDEKYWSFVADQRGNERSAAEDTVIELSVKEVEPGVEVTSSPDKSRTGRHPLTSQGSKTPSKTLFPRPSLAADTLNDVVIERPATEQAGVVNNLQKAGQVVPKNAGALPRPGGDNHAEQRNNESARMANNANSKEQLQPLESEKQAARPAERRQLPERTRKAPGRYRDKVSVAA